MTANKLNGGLFMSKRNFIIGIGVIALTIAWYVFRPELLFVTDGQRRVATAQPTSMAMSKGRSLRSWERATSEA
jgi:hypothetical protein